MAFSKSMATQDYNSKNMKWKYILVNNHGLT